MTVYEKSMQKQQWLTLQVENLTKAVEVTNELLLFDGSTTYLEVLTAREEPAWSTDRTDHHKSGRRTVCHQPLSEPRRRTLTNPNP